MGSSHAPPSLLASSLEAFAMWVLADLALVGMTFAVAILVIWRNGVSSAFAWHTVFMAIAFGCLMPMGRWTYNGMRWAPNFAKEQRRVMHKYIMIIATLLAIAGYICIFKAHVPNSLFGYNFVTGEWKAVSRMLHVWFGYATLLLVVFQAISGLVKARALQQGNRVFKQHGTLGLAILFLSQLTILAAVWVQKWPMSTAVPMIILAILVSGLVVCLPSPGPLAGEHKDQGASLQPLEAEG